MLLAISLNTDGEIGKRICPLLVVRGHRATFGSRSNASNWFTESEKRTENVRISHSH